jgi:signal transduction histidine kinase
LYVYSSDKASIEGLKKSVDLHYKMDNKLSIVTSLTRLGHLLTEGGYFDEGMDTLIHALALSENKIPVQMRLNFMAYQNRKAAQDFPAAIQYLNKYHAIKDSIHSANALENIRELEVQYNTREKELALVKEQELTRRRTWQRNFMILLAAAILWFSLFGILFFWNRSRLQKRITAQTEAIKNQQIQQLEQEKKLLMMSSMIEGQEAERKRIAQDLHDGLGGLLSSVKAQLNLIQHQVSQLESIDMYQKASNMIDHASTELRRIAFNMMPSALTKLGLREALEDLADTLRNDHQLDVDLQIFGLNGRLEETQEIMLYRILQELSNNIVKHANASKVLIQINRTDNELFLVVEDNGKGFDPHLTKIDGDIGVGMKSLQSRVNFLNGDLDIGSETGKGTCITIHIPLDQLKT